MHATVSSSRTAASIHCIMNVLCVLCASCDELLACCEVAACLHQCCLFSYVVAVFAMLSPHRCYVAQCRITTHVSLSFSLLTALPYCKCLSLWVNYPGDSTVPEQASAHMLVFVCSSLHVVRPCPTCTVLPYVSRCTHSRTASTHTASNPRCK